MSLVEGVLPIDRIVPGSWWIDPPRDLVRALLMVKRQFDPAPRSLSENEIDETWAALKVVADFVASRARIHFIETIRGGHPTSLVFSVLIIGLELERAVVDALWPKQEPKTVTLTSEPVTASVDLSSELEPERHPGGIDPIHPWEDAALYVDKHVEDTERPLPRHKDGKPHIQSAVVLMLEYFDNNKLRAPAEETVRRWIKANPERVARWWMTPQL
jgi:hypothetical protein